MSELLNLAAGYKRAEEVRNSKQWPKTVKCRFIEPGLVHYDDMGTILVQRPFLNKIASSFIGKPVIDEQHVDAKPENFKEVADGVVIRVWTDPTDGWDWCEFLVWDDAALRHTKDPQYSVSCAYTPSQVDRNGGKHNNVAYDGEFLDGIYTHLAIVKDPRYEQAKIVHNSKGGNSMSIFKLFSKKTVENSLELDKGASIEVDGERVSLADIVEGYRVENSKKNALKDDDLLEIDGEKVPVKNAIEAYRKNAKAKKNAQEKGEKAGDQDEAVEEEKEEGEKEAAENDIEGKPQKEDKARHEKIEAKNALGGEKGEEKGKHLAELKEAAEMRNNTPITPSINTMTERLNAGRERYGKLKKEVA